MRKVVFLGTLLLFISFANVFVSNRESVTIYKSSLEQDYKYWSRLVNIEPTYRDGYVILAQIERQRGNTASADRYAAIARAIEDGSVYGKNVLGTKTEEK